VCKVDFELLASPWQPYPVTQLTPPDAHHLTAALGWLELQAFDDAARELQAIESTLQDHPEVLEVRWALAANAGRWPEALEIATRLTHLVPGKPEGWIYQGSALVELGRPIDAYAALIEGQRRFLEDEILAYDLACVCCALERQDEALDWIHRAVALGGGEVLDRAVDDPDLERIRARLGDR